MSKARRSNVYESRLVVSPNSGVGTVAPLGTLLPFRGNPLGRCTMFQKLGAAATGWGTVITTNRGRITGFDHATTGALTVLVQPGRCRNNFLVVGALAATPLTFDLELAVATVADLAAAGVNGLDTGAVAINTWYSLFIIGDSRGINPTATLWSLNNTSGTPAVLPAGYDRFRRIGAARTTVGPALREFDARINGSYRQVRYRSDITTRQVLTGGASIGGATVLLTSYIPPNIIVVGTTAQFVVPSIGWFQAREDGTPEARLFSEGGLPAIAGPVVTITGGSNNQFNGPLPANHGTAGASQTIFYGHSAAGGLLQIWVMGYDEPI